MTGGFINSLTGVNLDWSTLLSATSAFSDYLEMPVAKCNPGNYKVASISGEKLSAFVDKFGNIIFVSEGYNIGLGEMMLEKVK